MINEESYCRPVYQGEWKPLKVREHLRESDINRVYPQDNNVVLSEGEDKEK